MTNDSIVGQRWYLVTIIDPEGLPGKNINNIIQVLMEKIRFKNVILSEIEGAGIYNLSKQENQILDINIFLNMLSDVKQFDWGDFYLFQDYPHHWDYTNGLNYPQIISQTDTTIRAIDDTYIYIYTPYIDLVNVLKDKFTIENMYFKPLEQMPYPF